MAIRSIPAASNGATSFAGSEFETITSSTPSARSVSTTSRAPAIASRTWLGSSDSTAATTWGISFPNRGPSVR